MKGLAISKYTNPKVHISAILLVAATLIALGGYGCGDDDEEFFIFTSRVRAIHLSPDAPNVDIYADQEPPAAVQDLAFGESTPFIIVEAGTYTFNITAAGDPPAQSVLDVGPLTLESGKAYTAVAFNEVAALQALPLEDDLSNPGAGNIRLRAIHAAPDVGEVDIYELSDPQNPALLYANVPFGVAGDYLSPLPAGSYTIGFDVNDDGAADLTFVTPALAAGSILNVFAVSDGPNDVFLIAQFQDGQTARIDPAAGLRAIHLSADAPNVDIFANGQEPAAVSDLAFTESTGFLNLMPGSYTFNISAAGTPPAQSVLDVGPLTLESGKAYTAVAFNEVAALQALPLEDDLSDPGAGSIRLRAIHAAPDVGEVDIYEVSDPLNPALLYADVPFGVAGAYLAPLPAASYSIGFDVNDDGAVDLTFVTPALPPGSILNVFAVSDGPADIFLIAQFQNGQTARIDPS